MRRHRRCVTLARQHADDVEWSAEDATAAATPTSSAACVRGGDQAGATTINLPDTVGYALPEDMERMFTAVREPGAGHREGRSCPPTTTTTWGWRVANTLAAIRAGVRQVEMHHQRHRRARRQRLAGRDRDGDAHPAGRACPYHEPHPDHRALLRMSKLLATITGFDVQPNKAIVGRNAFAHEAGIHQDGVLKDAAHLRDHDAGKRRLGQEQPGAGQAFRPRRVPRQAEDAGLRRSATTS